MNARYVTELWFKRGFTFEQIAMACKVTVSDVARAVGVQGDVEYASYARWVR